MQIKARGTRFSIGFCSLEKSMNSERNSGGGQKRHFCSAVYHSVPRLLESVPTLPATTPAPFLSAFCCCSSYSDIETTTYPWHPGMRMLHSHSLHTTATNSELLLPPEINRIWGIWESYYNLPKAIFYLRKGDYILVSSHGVCRDTEVAKPATPGQVEAPRLKNPAALGKAASHWYLFGV